VQLGTSPLKALRQSRALTVEDLSRVTGLSSTTVAFLEKGARPTPAQLIALAKGYGLDAAMLATTLATGTLSPAKAGAHEPGQ